MILKHKTFIKLRFAAYVLAHTSKFEFNLTAAVNDIFITIHLRTV